MNNELVTSEELHAFVSAISARHEQSLKEAYPTCNLNWERISLVRGQRYAKLVKSRPEVNSAGEIVGYHNSSAFAFIDLTNGDIFKPASWKAPAKHARGNIRRGDASNLWNGAFVNPSGLHVSYLR